MPPRRTSSAMIAGTILQQTQGGRLVLLTTRATQGHHQVEYRSDDILMLGNESGGAAPHVHDAAILKVGIPMVAGMRSLNVAVAAGIVLAEALRQLKEFPN